MPDHGFEWWPFIAQSAVQIILALGTVALTVYLIERRKEAAEVRERMRAALAEYLAQAHQMLRKSGTVALKQRQVERFGDSTANRVRKEAELEQAEAAQDTAWGEAFVARTRMLVLSEPEQLREAEKFFNHVFMWSPPAREDRKNPRDDDFRDIRYTIEFLNEWSLRQPSSLAQSRPRFDYSIDFWKPAAKPELRPQVPQEQAQEKAPS